MRKNVLIALQVLILGALVVPGKKAEASVSAACQAVINNSVKPSIRKNDSTIIDAIFTPNYGYSRVQAANICGVKDFDWAQIITSYPLPNPTKPNDSKILLIPPYSDPPPSGYTYESYPDNAYPYYYDPKLNILNPKTYNSLTKTFTTELALFETDYTLSFTDQPRDTCLPGGLHSANCNGNVAALGSKIAFSTYLVGVLPDYSLLPLGGIGFNWTSNNNGLYGGIAFAKNSDSLDDGSDIDAITITGEMNTFDEAFNEAFKAVKIPESSVFGVLSIPSLLLMLFMCKRKKPSDAI